MKQIDFTKGRPNREEILKTIQNNRHPISLLADGVVDPRNLGSLFRLADSARISHLYLRGLANDWEPDKRTKRVARMTENYVPWSVVNNLSDLPSQLKLVALEWTDKSVVYTKYDPDLPICLVVGSEKQGISEEVLALCQTAIHLPMHGVNTSMNVIQAAGIAVYHLLHTFET